AEPPATPFEWLALLQTLAARVTEIEDIAGALSHEHGAGQFDQLGSWTRSFAHQLREHGRDLATLAPWCQPFTASIGPALTACSRDVAAVWKDVLDSLDRVTTLDEIPVRTGNALEKISGLRKSVEKCAGSEREKAIRGLDVLKSQLEQSRDSATELLSRYATLARQSQEMIDGMDFRFLFDEERKVFIIGYNVTDGRRDNSYYDLLASEARVASFMAIAKGDVPQEHWFHLGRAFTQVDGGRALISWTATMFEYLMPLLVMRSYPGTLLDLTHSAVVRRQIEYGRERGVPWGVSESAYNARDLQLNYQYGPFGIPGLGLKRGLSDDLVVSPYSTALAAMVEPRAALDNMRRLIREDALTGYGFYESIDYTRERLQADQD